ncbi:FimV/HubP family polar landmark protein [Ramlibacter pinisoli]
MSVAAALSFPATDAHALALGRVTVQSALGERLLADIDLPEINGEEAASLRAAVASPAAYRAAGLDYNPALQGVSITLQRRSDGRYFLRLQSERAVSEPFVDMLVETSWSSGRITRDFTLLLDPPSLRQGQAPITAQAAPAPATPSAAAPAAGVTAVPRAARPVAAVRPPVQAQAAAPSPAPAAAPAPAGEGKQVTVQGGDTAGKIAAGNKPATVSLDQMLVAMLRSNPDAFVGGNINRLRSGAVLSLPSQAQAEAVPPAEATQTLVAQSRDFNEFRRRLAEGVPTAPAGGAERQASGKVQAQVDEKKPAASAPDKLTLSKGAVQSRSSADAIATQRAAQDEAKRVAELNQNIKQLQDLSSAASAPKAGAAAAPGATAAAPGKPASGPATGVTLPVATPAAPVAAAASAASAPAASAPAPVAPVAAAVASDAAQAASAPLAGASATPLAATTAPAAEPAAAASAPRKKPSVPPPPPPEPSFVDELLDNPLIPAALGGVLALLAGVGIWKVRQRRKATQVDSSFLESRLQPDSFFGASGGQRVDTAEGAPTGSSMVYSPSQLDAAGDVDPVAEADVYLAYGRDLQAEEILKEALRTSPQRVAIHVKLLEIYAKRRDAKAFEQVASEAYSLSHGEGSEWARICELGQELDPSNSMYRPGGQPVTTGAAPVAAAPVAAAVAGAAAAAAFTATAKQAAEPVAPAADVDLDLDFSLDDPVDAAPAFAAPPAAEAVATQAMPAQPLLDDPLSMDFSVITPVAPLATPAPDLASADNSLNFDLPAISAPATAVATPAPAADSGMLEFDLGGLSLDLPGAAPARAEAADTVEGEISTTGLDLSSVDGDDPLATKLALAQEFNAIGDADGARSLAQEVIAEASGDLKNKAQRFLAEIG